jgi:ubiquinone/menaquinone biosynthesis C-methylase UbiE
MSSYDFLSNFYDASLTKLYAEQRQLAVQALALQPGAAVLDVPCGTGASFDALAAGVGKEGSVIGVDTSAGMLARARARCDKHGLRQVQLLEADAATLDPSQLGGRELTHLHVFLGMSVFPDMQTTFDRLWSLLAKGGRCVLVDVHADRLGVQGFLVNKLANADIRRRFWGPLERVGSEFELRDLPFRKQHGGQIKLAVAVKR